MAGLQINTLPAPKNKTKHKEKETKQNTNILKGLEQKYLPKILAINSGKKYLTQTLNTNLDFVNVNTNI